jgi:LPXTG-site transpeptidase (sortase) family protein
MFCYRLLGNWLFGIGFGLLVVPVSVFASSSGASTDQAVGYLQRTGIIDVPASGDIRLFDYLNRAEALKVILKSQLQYAADLAAISGKMPELPLFPDVNQKAWYAPYIELGFRKKLIAGDPDGFFRPQDGVKVEEAAVMLVRSLGGGPTEHFRSSADLTNKDGQWYTSAINILLARGAVAPGSGLKVGDYLTRGQFFELVYRLQDSSGQATPSETSGNSNALLQYASKKPFAITIPSLGILDLTVTHPDDPFTSDGILAPLRDGVGHLFSFPGEGSKVMVYGHSSGYPWDLSEYTKIFRAINKIEIGSRAYVTYQGKLYVYQVSEKGSVSAKDRKPFEPDDNGEELILYTCWPPDSISQRYLVHAVPVETIALN